MKLTKTKLKQIIKEELTKAQKSKLKKLKSKKSGLEKDIKSIEHQ